MAIPIGDLEAILRLRDEFSSPLTQAMGKIGSAVAGVVTAGAALKLVTDSLKAQAEQEAAINKLNLALANQGHLLGDTSKNLVDYAGALQNVSTYADEVILSGEAMLASFGMTEEQIKSTTQVALDFAAATGTDLTAAVNLLGKAYAGNTAALGRYGIVVDENLKGTAKFDAVIKQLSDRFGGSALAATKTYTGQVAMLQNQYGEVEESLGKFLGTLLGGDKPFSTAIEWAKALAKFLGQDMVIAVSEIRARILEFFASIASGGKYIKPLVDGLKGIGMQSDLLDDLVAGGDSLATALQKDADAERAAGEAAALANGKLLDFKNGVGGLPKPLTEAEEAARKLAKTLAEGIAKAPVHDVFRLWAQVPGYIEPAKKAVFDFSSATVDTGAKNKAAIEEGKKAWDELQKKIKEAAVEARHMREVAMDEHGWAAMAAEATFEMDNLGESLYYVNDLLAEFGVNADSSTAQLIEGLAGAAKGAAALAEGLASGNPAGIIGGIAGIAGALKGLITGESGLGRIIGGALVGGPIGAIGALLFGHGGPSAAERMAHDIMVLRTETINAAGGIEILQANAAAAGVSLDALWNARTVEEYQSAIDRVNAAIELHQTAVDKTKEAMERWGLAAADMGPEFASGMLHEQLVSILQDFELLTHAGADAGVVLGSDFQLAIDKLVEGGASFEAAALQAVAAGGNMGAEINNLVQQSLEAGVALPESMRGMIQRLIDMGLLFDETGSKITDISTLPFTETLEAQVQNMVDAIHDLVNALMGIPREVETLYKLNYETHGTPPPGPDFPSIPEPEYHVPGHASGFFSPALTGDYLFQAHSGERLEITPAAQTPARNAMGGGDGEMNVTFNHTTVIAGERFDEVITRRIRAGMIQVR